VHCICPLSGGKRTIVQGKADIFQGKEDFNRKAGLQEMSVVEKQRGWAE
jgi:hypothetical protein